MINFPNSPAVGDVFNSGVGPIYIWDGVAWSLTTPSGQALVGVSSLNGGPLQSFRNQIINGDFVYWQRATTQTTSGYGADDRWNNGNLGTTKTVSQQPFTLGQTAVPGNPTYSSRTAVTSVAGAGNYCAKLQPIESVGTLAGKTATVTFYAKADASRNIAVGLAQNFGTGGSPSAQVANIGTTTFALTTSWQKFTFTTSIPSITGKTLGSNSNDSLQLTFWFDAGSSFNSQTNSLGQQSGTFDIAHVSLVEGDATKEFDPFSPRHYQQELALCQRYYFNTLRFSRRYYAPFAGARDWTTVYFPAMRTLPATTLAGSPSFSNVTGDAASALSSSSLNYEVVNTGVGDTMAAARGVILDAEL